MVDGGGYPFHAGFIKRQPRTATHGRGSDAEYFNNAYKKFFSSLFLVFQSLPFDFDIGPTDIEENVRPKPPFEDGAICFPRCWSISHAGLLLLLPGGVDHQ